jgi:hypothetical protein
MIIRTVLIAATLALAQPPRLADPVPQDATKAILATFDKYEVVGIHAAHGGKDLDDYILSLLQAPEFPNKVNDVVVECGNSWYQPVLDRYVAGEDVSAEEMQLVWRDTTELMCSLSGFYEHLFPLVRNINRKLPAERRLRVLAADPPVDWSTVTSGRDVPTSERDVTITTVMKDEVLAKHRKALMLFGLMHLLHGLPMNPPADETPMRATAVSLYEQTYPGVTFVIIPHRGFGTFSHLEPENAALEARLRSWPTPSLVPLKDNWIGNLGAAYFFQVPNSWRNRPVSTLADAYLYLGPLDSLRHEPTPPDILADQVYMNELQRRKAIGGTTFNGFSLAAIRQADADPHFYPPR